MATADEQARQEERRRAAAAAAAAGTLVVVGDPAAPVAGVPPAGARAAAAGSILAALVAYLAAQRARVRGWLTERLRRRAPQVTPDTIEALVAEEERRQAEFERRQAERLARDLTTALAIPDPAARDGAVRGLMARERRYARQRDEAMAARAFAAVDRVVLRQQSPMGAFWKLDPTVREHTAGCLVMGGKFWPWQVLERVHPPRHAGCPCRLLGYGEAIAEGHMAPGAVMDVQTAIRRAAAVVMEGVVRVPAEDADALIEDAGGRELMELRQALVEAGMVADEVALDVQLTERFDPDQPRWPKGHPKAGKWRPKVAAGVSGRRSSAGWLAKDIAELRTLIEPKRVGTTRSGDGPEVPIMRGPSSTEELERVGASISKLAERYGTWHADRERIDALHAERRSLADRKNDRIEAAGGWWKFFDDEQALAKREGRDPSDRAALERMDALLTLAERERLKAIDAEVARLLKQEERGKRDAVLGILAQLRPMGGKLRTGEMFAGWEEENGVRRPVRATPTQRRDFAPSLSEALRYVPSSWIEDSNRRGRVEFEFSTERAWHRMLPASLSMQAREVEMQLAGEGSEFVGYLPDGRPVTKNTYGAVQAIGADGTREMLRVDGSTDIPGVRRDGWQRPEASEHSQIRVRVNDPSTLLHELAHRFEMIVGEEGIDGRRPLLRATSRFLRERAGDSQTELLRDIRPDAGYEAIERTWRDDFVEPYIGKDYAGRATEVLTMGLQMIFFPTYGRDLVPPKHRGEKAKRDEPMRDFILGLLAAM